MLIRSCRTSEALCALHGMRSKGGHPYLCLAPHFVTFVALPPCLPPSPFVAFVHSWATPDDLPPSIHPSLSPGGRHAQPGSNAKAINKARQLPTDVVVMDLEDAVAPEKKVEARSMVLDELQQGGFGRRELAVRANGLETEWAEDDIAMIARSGAHAVAVPKVEGGAVVAHVRELLAKHNAPPELAVWAMIETPLGVLRAEEICIAGKAGGDSALSRANMMTAVIMGTSDLTKDLRAEHTTCRSALVTSLQLVLLAARAHGMLALDGVHLDLKNTDELLAHCRCRCQALWLSVYVWSSFLLDAKRSVYIHSIISLTLAVCLSMCGELPFVSTCSDYRKPPFTHM